MSSPFAEAPVPISLYSGGDLPPFQPGPLNFDYLLAGNGLFLRGRQSGLEIVVPVSMIRGLPLLVPGIRWDYPLVPPTLVAQMLHQACQARTPDGGLLEILFYLTYEDKSWQLHTPEQDQTPGSVLAREVGVWPRTLIEVHSHGALRPFFSATDNRSEGLLRIYAVLGRVGTSPAILTRGGAYGVYLPVPASMIFDLTGTEIVDEWFSDGFGQEPGQEPQEGNHGSVF